MKRLFFFLITLSISANSYAAPDVFNINSPISITGSDHPNGISINNDNNIVTSGTASDIIVITDASIVSGPMTIEVKNNAAASLVTSGANAIPVYIPGGTFNFSLLNQAGATISSGNFYAPVYVFNYPGGTNSVVNSGTIVSTTNRGGVIRSALYFNNGNTTVTNSGTIQASVGSDYAIRVVDANLTVNVETGSTIIGKLRADGSNNILNVNTELSADALNTLFAQIDTSVGSWTKNISTSGTINLESGMAVNSITANSTVVSNSGTIGTFSSSGTGNILTLNAGSVMGTIDNSGSLIINTSGVTMGNINNSGNITMATGAENLSYLASMSGAGNYIKTGSGILTLGATSTATGTIDVQNGELKVNGSTAQDVIIESGAKISGNGVVDSLVINSGGTLAPGNSIGTLNVSSLTLDSGSISNFEFDKTSIDKVIASGNISVAGTANFNLYNTAGGYFVVNQDILKSTGGTVSGSFDNVNVQDGYIANLQYNSDAVNATISKKIDSNALDGTLMAQNSTTRILSKNLFNKLIEAENAPSNKTAMWISANNFNNNRQAVANSSTYSTSGVITSFGLAKNFKNDFQLVGGLFSAQSNVKRYVYSGSDSIYTNGLIFGAGKNYKTLIGEFYLSGQVGAAYYNSDNDRYVNVNGSPQRARGNSKGSFEYLTLATSYKLPLAIKSEVSLFALARAQKTRSDGWKESGLTAGNLEIGNSSANTLNFEFGTAYKNDLPKILSLPPKSFYKVGITGYKSQLYSKNNATATQGNATYILAPTYEQKIFLGASALMQIPVQKNTNFYTQIDRRQNDRFREFIVSIGAQYAW